MRTLTLEDSTHQSPPHTHTQKKKKAKETTQKHPSENELVLTVCVKNLKYNHRGHPNKTYYSKSLAVIRNVLSVSLVPTPALSQSTIFSLYSPTFLFSMISLRKLADVHSIFGVINTHHYTCSVMHATLTLQLSCCYSHNPDSLIKWPFTCFLIKPITHICLSLSLSLLHQGCASSTRTLKKSDDQTVPYKLYVGF